MARALEHVRLRYRSLATLVTTIAELDELLRPPPSSSTSLPSSLLPFSLRPLSQQNHHIDTHHSRHLLPSLRLNHNLTLPFILPHPILIIPIQLLNPNRLEPFPLSLTRRDGRNDLRRRSYESKKRGDGSWGEFREGETRGDVRCLTEEGGEVGGEEERRRGWFGDGPGEEGGSGEGEHG